MTWIFDARRNPINLPDTPQISREDSDLIWRADITIAAWMARCGRVPAHVLAFGIRKKEWHE